MGLRESLAGSMRGLASAQAESWMAAVVTKHEHGNASLPNWMEKVKRKALQIHGATTGIY